MKTPQRRPQAQTEPQSTGKQAPPPRPVTPRDLFEVGQRIALVLCVALSCFAVIFASCAKAPSAETEPPAASPVTSPLVSPTPSPETSPDSTVSPAL